MEFHVGDYVTASEWGFKYGLILSVRGDWCEINRHYGTLLTDYFENKHGVDMNIRRLTLYTNSMREES